ncbi:MAG: hypothetical protein JXR40_01150 [Pontiellaceae bacterium]|nr:hypothetical protein [Pontiellaceae bacterium]
MEKIIGRFYFKLSSNGNLLGEYSNNKSQDCDVEAAKRLPEWQGTNINSFVGKYQSTWTEGDSYHSAILTITNWNAQIYSLEWSRDNKTDFKGEAMIMDGILIGNYWSV